MSDSRLEKFIYAICSMDVSDLPVPLSRIEKLWNCLITGETPDFEPLSRNEKYLMAMLDRYDISNLPAPMSRGEKLLYKIAVGETDLSDVPGYLSRYEELLKYLIENGGISGGDFEYVLYTINQSLYTLYTTAEKPVKSAILKGQTLVNLSLFKDTALNVKGVREKKCYNKDIIKPKTNYLISYNVVAVSGETVMKIDGMNVNSFPTELGKHKMIVRTISNLTTLSPNNLWITSNSNSIEIDDFLIIEYQDGMENWDIPYFEGMQSVKMPVLTTTGKNLFNINAYTSLKNNATIEGEWLILGENYQANSTSTWDITLAPNTSYYVSDFIDSDTTNNSIGRFRVADKMGNEVLRLGGFNRILTTTNECDYILEVGRASSFIGSITKFKIQIEKGSDATSYEPFKSNILTVNEDVTLRGIGEVQDTLNCLTGEVTQRVYELVLDGSENWRVTSQTFQPTDSNFINFDLGVNSIKRGTDIICNNIPVRDWRESSTELKSRSIATHSSNSILRLCIEKSIASDVVTLKQYLQSNNSKVYYQPTTESIKTVDLTVVDQDSQPTKLGTFENVTHVSLESAGLIPEVEMEVATKISEELASASPLMNDISTNQQQLETTVDEQSNNVDATMIATTEIYEETL